MIKLTVKNSQEAKAILVKALKDFMTNKSLTIGIHEDGVARTDGSVNNATLGAIQHFGNDDIPARPWLDVGVASGNREYLQIITDNPDDPEKALHQIGVVAVAKVQQYMVELKTPPNAKSTIAAKGSSNPLIDTGSLRQSVTFAVTGDELAEGIG